MDKHLILLAHHQELYRSLLVDFYNRQQDFQVIADTGDGEEAVQLCKMLKPDLIFLDPYLTTCNGLKAARLIKQAWPDAKIIILAPSQDEDILFQALKQGVYGFLDTTLSPPELLKYTRGALNGESPLTPSLTVALIEGIHRLSKQVLRSRRKRVQNPMDSKNIAYYG
ncbi:MAG: response regulator transcription factor [Clostridia bacterium]|nr:response regulator transcription factor [Clostridia bacterium]